MVPSESAGTCAGLTWYAPRVGYRNPSSEVGITSSGLFSPHVAEILSPSKILPPTEDQELVRDIHKPVRDISH